MAQAKIEYREQPIGVSNSSVFGRAFNTLNKQLRATDKNGLSSPIIGAYEAIAKVTNTGGFITNILNGTAP